MWLLFEIALAICSIFIFGVFYWYLTIPKNLPPGPTGLPFIGSSLETSKASRGYSSLTKWAQQYGPLYKIYVADKLVIVLGNWNVIHEALVKQGDVFSGRPRLLSFAPANIPLDHGLVGSDGALWKEQRRFALSTLRDFGLGRSLMEPRIKEEIDHFLAEIENRRQSNPRGFDPQTLIVNAVSNVICALVFGRRFDYNDAEFIQLLQMLNRRTTGTDISFLTPFVLSDWFAALLAFTPMVKQIQAETMKMIEFLQARVRILTSTFEPETTAENFTHAFLKAQRQNQGQYFNDMQLLLSVGDLFGAGTETTSSTLRWAIAHLARNPKLQDQIYNEILQVSGDGQLPSYADRNRLPLVEAAIMETQRIADLVPWSVMHRTTAATTLMGYDIPADTLVVPLLTAVLYDPRAYPDPDNFDPYRFLDEKGKVKKDPQLIPFSVGKRSCLGESLARMELFLFFTALFATYKFSYPPGQPVPPLEAQFSFTRSPKEYNICVHRRQHEHLMTQH